YRVVAHAFSTKLAGNMASGHSSGLANRQRFFDTLGWPTSHCVSMEQVDGTTIAVVSQSDSADIISPQTIDGVDGLLCRDQGVYLVTQTADNLPVLYFDTHLRVIGLAHAGWRGIVGKLPMLMVTTMQRQF